MRTKEMCPVLPVPALTPAALALDALPPDHLTPDDLAPDDLAPGGPTPDDAAPENAAPENAAPENAAARETPPAAGRTLASLRPLATDVALPVGTYFLLRDAAGLSLWLALAGSSVVPAIRSVSGLVRQRQANVLAMLVLVVNLAGLAVSFATGDPRLMIVKDSVISSVIAFALLGSVAAGRPLMTAGLQPWLTRGAPDRTAAWDRLLAGRPRFRRLESLYTVIWGVALLGDCTARIIGAVTLPVATMAWLGTVFTLGGIGVAIMAGGVAAGPMLHMVEAETGRNGA
jgi:hypothetical protein